LTFQTDSGRKNFYSLIIRCSSGITAGWPLCCQQRSVPRTRRWQGVPFFVSAPQIETVSDADGVRSVFVLLPGSGLAGSGALSMYAVAGAG
jgi:hypothetical protein